MLYIDNVNDVVHQRQCFYMYTEAYDKHAAFKEKRKVKKLFSRVDQWRLCKTK